MQQSLDAKCVIRRAVVVQGLSAQLECFGQFALGDSQLYQLDYQQLSLGLFTEINLLEQGAAMVDLAFVFRTVRKMKLIGPANGKARLRHAILFHVEG